MNDDLESRLRRTLRPVAPPEGLHERIVARLAAAPKQKDSARSPAAWWVGVGLAASMLIAAAVGVQLKASKERAEGLEARRQVIEALRVTQVKLDLAYQTVRDQSS
jgi:hypothetical protein